MDDNYLAHYGIKGQKWGIRRFQNPDGSLTDEGAARIRKRYQKTSEKFYKAADKSDRHLSIAQNYNKKANKFFSKLEDREENARLSDLHMRASTFYARRAIRAINKMDKLFGQSVTNLDSDMVQRGNNLIERNNAFTMSQVNTYYIDRRMRQT